MILLSILYLIISIHIIRKSSSSFDIAANFLTMNVGEGIKGPTINAIASSLPELLISSLFLFYFKDLEGFSAGYGTIIGSSAFNIALIPVIAFIFIRYSKAKSKVFEINKSIVKQDTFFLLCSIFILSAGFFFSANFLWASSLILFYLIYIYYVIKTRVSKKEDGTIVVKKFLKNHKKRAYLKIQDKYFLDDSGSSLYSAIINFRLFKIFFKSDVNRVSSILVVLISVILIGASCYLLVLATEEISNFLGINLFVGAFIIAAIASSIPDTVFSVQDAKNGKFIDSFSNAYGSNIFDICIGIGLPVLVYTSIYGPIDMNLPISRIGFLGDYILDGNLFLWSLIILLLFTSLVSLIYIKKKLTMTSVFLIFLLYVLFLITLLIF